METGSGHTPKAALLYHMEVKEIKTQYWAIRSAVFFFSYAFIWVVPVMPCLDRED